MKIMPEIRSYCKEDQVYISSMFPADWKFNFDDFIALHSGKNYFKGYTVVLDSVPIGYGGLMIFGETAWLGNIVIHPECRIKGFGTLLTKHLLDEGLKSGVKSFTLIATKLGEPVYRKFGFESILMYEFYRPGENTKTLEFEIPMTNAGKEHLEAIAGIDFEVMGENRKELLENCFNGTKIIADSNNRIKGFYFKNLGNGLIIARDKKAGCEFLKILVIEKRNIVINEKNKSAADFLISCGYEKYLEAPRMLLGENFNWKPEFIFSRGAGFCG